MTSPQSGRSLDRWLLVATFFSSQQAKGENVRYFPVNFLCNYVLLIPWKVLEIFHLQTLWIKKSFAKENFVIETLQTQLFIKNISQRFININCLRSSQRQIKVSFWQPFSHRRTPTHNLRPSIFHKKHELEHSFAIVNRSLLFLAKIYQTIFVDFPTISCCCCLFSNFPRHFNCLRRMFVLK